MAAQYFMEHAFDRFAFTGFPNFFWSEVRGESFVEELKRRGKEAIYVYHRDAFYSEERRAQYIEWLTALPKPIAMFACNDDLAQGVLDVCNQVGIRVPEEVSILGVDNDELVCNLTHPPLSSIKINFPAAGFEAVRHLVSLICNKREPVQGVYANPINIITRHSTDIFTVNDADVLSALRFIERNTRELIQVTDVADHVALTRQGLNKKFSRYLGRSVHDEILRAKINYISLLLNNTTLPISAIALSVGYSEPKQLSRVFRQRTGMSPTQYRKHHSNMKTFK